MFTGQLMAFPVYYVVVNYLYVGCWYLINMVIESVCFGVSNNWNPGKSCILSPIYYLTNNLRIQSVENSEYVTVGIEFKGAYLLGIYAVAGVVFLIAAYQLYKRRKLETAGDLISMRGSSRCSAGAWLSAPVCLEEIPLLTRSETVFLRQRYIFGYLQQAH